MTLPRPKGVLRAEGLTVSAGARDRPLLQGVSFNLDAGEMLGIIGPTGAGKSTLVRSLIGACRPVRGSVTIDGASLDQWDTDHLGAFVGYLPQDASLFAGTVAENISRLAWDGDPQDIVRAAERAHVHEMIVQLPQGYETQVGDGGSVLSAGQRQRIGLARALYGDPVLVILDEPNAHLDEQGEIALMKTLRGLREHGRTVVLVAHRPGAIRIVDKALYIKDGRNLGFGPRDDVLARVIRPVSGPGPSGTFADLPSNKVGA